MSLFAELKRRNVIRVAIAYAIVAWVIAQVAEFAFENFGAPDWVLKSVVVMLLLGLPLAIFFAWAFELTPDGIKREKEVDRDRSIVAQTGHKLDRMIIAVLVIALAWFAWDKFYIGRSVAALRCYGRSAGGCHDAAGEVRGRAAVPRDEQRAR